MRMKKGDMLILIVLIISAVSWFGVRQLNESKDERQIVIEIDGNIHRVIPMEAGMEKQEIHIEFENGKYIDIVADERGAYVSDVVCPDRICQKTGLVSRVGQSIVCLPNRVVVYIEGETEPEVDDVSY